MRNRCLIANWKMNLPPAGIDEYLRRVSGLTSKGVEIVIAPPYPFLSHVRSVLQRLQSRASVCAQNCSDQEGGPFTGEVSAPMVRDSGATFVLIGHSERRTLFGETDDLLARKLKTVAAAGLTAVLCVGETEKQREAGETNRVLDQQLDIVLRGRLPSLVMIAYEPVWAIGTGKTASADQAGEAHRHIRERLGGDEVPILYGGSVTPENAGELAAREEIDGFLVGGASLDAAKFGAIFSSL